MGISSYIKQLREKLGNDMLLLPGVSAIVVNEQNQVLLQRARNDGKWHLIGGGMEPGEEPAHAIIREVLEETGLVVTPIRIVAVQASPLVTYPNGHQVRYVITSFFCRPVGGHLHVADDESLELRYFALDELPELRPDQLQRVRYALGENPSAFFQPAR